MSRFLFSHKQNAAIGHAIALTETHKDDLLSLLYVLTQGASNVHCAVELAQGGDPQRPCNNDGGLFSSSKVLFSRFYFHIRQHAMKNTKFCTM